jgi:aminopeptidase
LASPVNAEDRLAAYARLAVRVGVNLQPGQPLHIRGLVEHAPLVRAIAAEAWKAGSSYVDASYTDQHVKRELIAHGSDEALTHTPPSAIQRLNDQIDTRGAQIEITGNPEPDLFDGLDSGRVGRTRMAKLAELSGHAINEGLISWSIVSYPTEGWAQAIFGEPDVERLWQAVAFATRLDEPDPVQAWRDHVDELLARAAALTRHEFDAIRYTGPGTDLTVGLNPGSRWHAAEFTTAWGQTHLPNLPTEEVFTTPDWRRAEGTVRATKPLNLPGHGLTVHGLELRFEAGRAVEVRAESGADAIRSQLALDANASFLGEIALVDGTSKIGQTGITFRDTLFDENAASHIAYGRGISLAVEGAVGRSPEEQQQLGVNQSLVHTDFMVGGPEIEIDGVTRDGGRVPIIHRDVWKLPA